MANFPGQYRQTGKGPYRHQAANWKAALAVAAGDFVYQDTADTTAAGAPYDKSASAFTWTTDLATTQTNFKAKFKGVSTVRRTTGQTVAGTESTDGTILGSGEFCFPCAALGAALVPGSYVGLAANGSALDPAKVVSVATSALAIGKLTEAAAIGATRLTFELMPLVLGDLSS
jgi:hypothetical protein